MLRGTASCCAEKHREGRSIVARSRTSANTSTGLLGMSNLVQFYKKLETVDEQAWSVHVRQADTMYTSKEYIQCMHTFI